ncbi:recombinase family protein, partial [Mesorhizobium sp. ZMM04-5]
LEYSPDGEWIYFNSERASPGHAQCAFGWRRRTGGSSNRAADTVRMIFQRYRSLQSVPAVADEVNAGGESHVDASDADRMDAGAMHGSSASGRGSRLPSFTRGKLYHMLSNVVYIGKARHKDRIYDGEHEAIIDESTFRSVQALLKGQAPNRRSGPTARADTCSQACCLTRPATV